MSSINFYNEDGFIKPEKPEKPEEDKHSNKKSSLVSSERQPSKRSQQYSEYVRKVLEENEKNPSANSQDLSKDLLALIKLINIPSTPSSASGSCSSSSSSSSCSSSSCSSSSCSFSSSFSSAPESKKKHMKWGILNRDTISSSGQTRKVPQKVSTFEVGDQITLKCIPKIWSEIIELPLESIQKNLDALDKLLARKPDNIKLKKVRNSYTNMLPIAKYNINFNLLKQKNLYELQDLHQEAEGRLEQLNTKLASIIQEKHREILIKIIEKLERHIACIKAAMGYKEAHNNSARQTAVHQEPPFADNHGTKHTNGTWGILKHPNGSPGYSKQQLIDGSVRHKDMVKIKDQIIESTRKHPAIFYPQAAACYNQIMQEIWPVHIREGTSYIEVGDIIGADCGVETSIIEIYNNEELGCHLRPKAQSKLNKKEKVARLHGFKLNETFEKTFPRR